MEEELYLIFYLDDIEMSSDLRQDHSPASSSSIEETPPLLPQIQRQPHPPLLRSSSSANNIPRGPETVRLINLIKVMSPDNCHSCGMGPREAKRRDLFSTTIQYLHIILMFGYWGFLVPFRVYVGADGLFRVKVGQIRVVITGFLLFLGTSFRLLETEYAFLKVNMADPRTSIKVVEKSLSFLLMLSYSSLIIFWKKEFTHHLFPSFNRKFSLAADPSHEKHHRHLVLIMLPLLLFFVAANWIVWGQYVYEYGFYPGLRVIFREYLDLYQVIPERSGNNTALYIIILWTTNIVKIHAQLQSYFIEFMMWGVALTILCMEKAARDFILCEEKRKSDFCFDLKEAIQILRDVESQIWITCQAVGFLTVMYYLQLIPSTVAFIYTVELEAMKWTKMVFLPLKFGHSLVAAMACANMKTLIDEILVKRVTREPKDMMRVEEREEELICRLRINSLVEEFKDVTSQPLALRGMDIFHVNYRFLGIMALGILTNALIVVEWHREKATYLHLSNSDNNYTNPINNAI